MKATWKDKVIAESNDTVVVENNHYFPRSAVDSKYLVDSDHTSFCPWKGTANYFSLVVDGDTNPNTAWYYSDPKDAAQEIEGRVAFWHGVDVSE